MPGQRSSYGLKYHARCLCAHPDQTSINQWWTATNALNEENEIQLLEVDGRNEQLKLKRAFTHQHEVRALAAQQSDETLLCTAYSKGGTFGAKLWAAPNEGRELVERETLANECKDITNVLWQHKDNKIAILSPSQIQMHAISNSDAKEVGRIEAKEGSDFRAMAWNQADSNQIISANSKGTIQVRDLRSDEVSLEKSGSHSGIIRDLDISNSAQPLYASGGDDCYARVWDPRKLDEPIAAFNHHSHWVWQTKFNRKHAQLLATSSSDSTVTMVHLGDLGKEKTASHKRSPSASAKGQTGKTGAVESFSHDDSVYSIAWGVVDEWNLASLSYDGRVAVQQVPGSVKYSILL